MPPAGVGVGVWIVGVVKGMAISMAISAAVSAAVYYLTKKKSPFGNEDRDMLANGSATETYLPVIYGKSEIGFNRIFMNTDPKNRDWLYIAGVFSHGIIEGITKIKADGETIATYNKANKRWEIDDDYTDHVGTIQMNRGSDNAKHYSFIGDKFSDWTEDRRARGCAGAAIALRFNQDLFPAGIPRLTFFVKGNRLYDPRTPAEPDAYSNNLALVCLDLLKKLRYGARVKSYRIDYDSFIAEANHCDEVIAGDPYDLPTKCKPRLRKMKCALEYNAVYKYKYTYFSSWSWNDGYGAGSVEDQTAASDSRNVTITSKRGRVSVIIPAPTDANKEYIDKIKIWRTTANTDTYYFVREISYDHEDDDQELSFIDNLEDLDLAKNTTLASQNLYWDTGPGPATPSGTSLKPTVTFTAYSSDLTKDKYYRYKIIYGNANGCTQGGARSKAVKPIQGKKIVRIFDIPVSEDNSIKWRAIYRTPAMETATDDETDSATYPYKYLYTIDDNETEEYIDVSADSLLGDTGADSRPKGVLTPITCPGSEPRTYAITNGQQPRYTFDGIIDTSQVVINNLEEIVVCGIAKLFLEGGKWRIHIKKPAVAETFELNEDNIIGDWEFSLPGTEQLCSFVRVAFTDPKANEQTNYVTFPPKKFLNDAFINQNRFEIIKEVELKGVRDKRRAQRIAMIIRNMGNQSIPAMVKVKESALLARVGSVVKITHETPGFTAKKFWVEGYTIAPDATIVGMFSEYYPEAFDLKYLNADPPDDADTNLPAANEPPEEVKNVVLKDESYIDNYTTNWRIKVTFDNPTSPFWAHSDVYVKRGDDADYTYDQKISQDNAGVFYIQPIEAFTTYYIQILSVSTIGVSMRLNDEDDVSDDWEATVWSLEVTIPEPTWDNFSIELLGKSGNAGVAYGKDFMFRWKPYSGSGTGQQTLSSRNSLGITKTTGFTYYIQVCHDYASSVVVGGVNISTALAASYFTAETIGSYRYEDNIENSKTLFEGILKESSSGTINWNGKTYAVNTKVKNAQTYYDQYWGKGWSSIRVKISVIDEYNQMSTISEETTFTNPRPLMLGSDGALIPLSILNTKSGAEVSFQHPDKEYDITHFYLKYFRIGGWLANEAYLANDVILQGSTVYVCYQSGTSDPTTIPALIASEGGENEIITDNTCKWTHGASYITTIFALSQPDTTYQSKIYASTRVTISAEIQNNTEMIASLINVNSTDDDVANAYYTKEIKQLDPKYKYLIGVIPLDVFGKTEAVSNYAWGWAQPGLTDDDDENEITSPTTPVLVSTPLAESNIDMADGTTLNRLRFTWENNSRNSVDSDINYYLVQFVAVSKSDAVYADFVDEDGLNTAIEDGIINIGGDNYTVTEYQIEKDEASGTKTRAYLNSAEAGYTYFARVKAFNTSGLASAYTAIAANTTLSIQGDIEGIVMDSVSPSTIGVTELSEMLKIEVNITTPPDDLWGCKFAVKSSEAFLGTASNTAGKADRALYKTAEIAAKEGKIIYYFAGSAGVTYYVSAMPIDNSKNEAKLGGVISWLDAANSYEVLGISHESLGTSFKKYKYAGSFTATDCDIVTWTGDQLKIKGQSGSPFTITAGTTGNFIGTQVIYWLSASPTIFSVVDYDTFYTDTVYDNALALAWIEANSDTSQKAVVIPMTGDDFSISSSMISTNAVATGHLQAGSVDVTKLSVSQLGAITADLGTVTAGTITGTLYRSSDSLPYITIGITGSFPGINAIDSTGKSRIYMSGDENNPRLVISKSGYDARNVLSADELIFSTAYNYFKIVASGKYSYTLNSGTIAAGAMSGTVDDGELTTISGTNIRGVKGFIIRNTGQYIPLPHIQCTNNCVEVWELISNPPSGGVTSIRFKRLISNFSGSDQSFASIVADIYWQVLAETSI